MSGFWSLLAVPLLIALNAFFVSAEYAVVALRAAAIERMKQRGWRRVSSAMTRLQEDPTSAIGTIQVGITMTNLLLGWIGEPAMTAVLQKLLGPLMPAHPGSSSTVSIALSFIVVTLLTVVLSELLPKAMTLRYTHIAAFFTAVPVLTFQRVLFPLVWLMNLIADAITVPLGLGRVEEAEKHHTSIEELRLLASEAASAGVLTPRERSLVLNSLTLGRRSARQIMIPRMKVAYLDLQRSMEENRQVMEQFLYSRLPLCDGGMDHVVGMVHTKEFLTAYGEGAESVVLSLIARKPVFVPEHASLDSLLAAFRDQNTRIVLLADEYGGVEGIVTLQDVMKEFLGDAPAPDGVPVEDAGAPLVVPGDTPLHEIRRQLAPLQIPDVPEVVTIGGLIVAELGRIPIAGEVAQVGELSCHILQSTPQAIQQVEIRRRAAPPSQGA